MRAKLCIAALALLFVGTVQADTIVTNGSFTLGFPGGGWELIGSGLDITGPNPIYCQGTFLFSGSGTFTPCTSLGISGFGSGTANGASYLGQFSGSLTVTGSSIPLPPPPNSSCCVTVTGSFAIHGTIIPDPPIIGTSLGDLIVDGTGTYTYVLEVLPTGNGSEFAYEAGGASYTFSSVPEPASIFLLATGLIALVGIVIGSRPRAAD